MSERPKITQLSGAVEVLPHIYTIAGNTTGSETMFTNKTGATVKLTAATVVFDTAVTVSNTNNFMIQLINKGAAGAGTTQVCSKVSFNQAQGNLAALTPLAMTVSTTAANLLITAGEVLALDKTVTGAGLALPNGKLALQFQFV